MHVASLVPRHGRSPRLSNIHGAFQLRMEDYLGIARVIKAEIGIPFVTGDAPFVYARLGERMRELGFTDFHDYLCRLEGADGAAERPRMIEALTASVARFHNGAPRLGHFHSVAAPPLMEKASQGDCVRIWCVACARPQDAYSVALSMLSVSPRAARDDVLILGTDDHARSIAAWRNSVFTDDQLATVSDELRSRYFVGPAMRQAGDTLRRMVTFEPRGLLDRGGETDVFDAIFVGSPVFTFDEPTQERMWALIERRLAPDGWLYVGACERIVGPAADRLVLARDGVYRHALGERIRARAPARGLSAATLVDTRLL